ncbi:cellulase [Auriculariales sp. MPI-PUGE-AT-0066]|nr:cellulase [Auriculariales sp. MPI-PUGE-AT-0066]
MATASSSKGGNWHGASGTWEGSGDPNDDSTNHAGEASHYMALGLQIGVNSIRLPFASEITTDTQIIKDEWVAANPQLRGKTPLQVYDEVYRWCCGVNDGNERWNMSQDEEVWVQAWLFMVNRYKETSGWLAQICTTKFAGLFLTVRAKCIASSLLILNMPFADPNWGLWDSHDWFRAADNAANRILQANRDIMIIIEASFILLTPTRTRCRAGTMYHKYFIADASLKRVSTGMDFPSMASGRSYGLMMKQLVLTNFSSHGRPTLTPAGALSHTLLSSDKLVYSAHFYSYTGPNHSGATGTGETSDPRYRDLSLADLISAYRNEATFVALDTNAHYVHPVWISEFGIGRIGTGNFKILLHNDESEQSPGGNDADSNWFRNTVNHWRDIDVDFAYWPLVGYLENGNGNGWALQNWNKAGVRDGLTDGNDWRKDVWTSLINNTNEKTGPVDKVPVWRILNLDHADDVKSYGLLGNDWDNGARKAACPDGTRLIGVSRSSRGLCTDAGAPGTRIWSSTETVWTEKYVDGDWAGGFTKYTCPAGSYMIGLAVRGAKVSTVLCGLSSQPLGAGSKRTLWFDQGDNRGDNPLGGDWSSGNNKGQCQQDEHIGGIAFSTSVFRQGNPAAILCRK